MPRATISLAQSTIRLPAREDRHGAILNECVFERWVSATGQR